MSRNGTILVGTVGQGVMRSADYGESWQRMSVGQGLHSDATIRCLATHPARAGVSFAGSDRGLYRSEDHGAHWTLQDGPIGGQAVWSIAIDHENPARMIVGVGTPDPGAIYCTDDGGCTWTKASADIAESCPAVGTPRPLALALDPTDEKSMWAAFEVDGVRRSHDGGATWERAAPEILNPDAHCVLVTAGPPKTVLVLVNDDVWTSTDDGASFRPQNARSTFPWHHVRHVNVRPNDPQTVFVTIGDATPGRTGTIMRSTDAGQTWQPLGLPVQPNSAMWTLALPESDAGLMFAASRYGDLYRSEDNGDSWVKLWREFSEVSSVAWLPA